MNRGLVEALSMSRTLLCAAIAGPNTVQCRGGELLLEIEHWRNAASSPFLLSLFFRFYLGDCAHKSALLFGPITEHFLHHHPASFSSAPLPKQCMNLSKGKMLYHLANEYFIVCKTMYSLAFDLPLFSPLRPLARRRRMHRC